MHNKSCFRISFGNQRVSESHTLQNSAKPDFYPTSLSLYIYRAGKHPFQSDLKSQDCMLTHSLSMPGILAAIRGTYNNQFKCTYLKNQKLFAHILILFQNRHKTLNILKKNLNSQLTCSRNYSLREIWILECVAGLVSEDFSAVSVLTGPTHCKTLQNQTFILHFLHSSIVKAGKRPFQSDVKSQDCMLSADVRYSRHKTGNLQQAIQMHLS